MTGGTKNGDSTNTTTAMCNDTVNKPVDECIDAMINVDERGKQTQWYSDSRHGVYCTLDDEDGVGELIASAVGRVRIRPAMDSGAVDHVIHPRELPDDAFIVPNTTGKNYRGANDTIIERYGSCETILEGSAGTVGCTHQLANVSRPLHSVSRTCGPPGGTKNAKQDVFFNNDACVVVPPDIVAEILTRVTPIAKYDREGDLYVGEMTMSSSHRQEPLPYSTVDRPSKKDPQAQALIVKHAAPRQALRSAGRMSPLLLPPKKM